MPADDTLRLALRARDTLAAAADTLCLERAELVTEAHARHEAEPPPLRRALAFAHVLDGMTIDVATNPLFAGNTSSRPRGWMLLPEYGLVADPQVLLENEGLDGLMEGVPERIRAYWRDRAPGVSGGIGHFAVDLRQVVEEGFDAIAARLRDRDDGSERPENHYRRAAVAALEAVVRWAHRCADAAERAASTASDPAVGAAHARVAASCRHVPARPARSLHEALQAMALAHLAIAIEGHGMSLSIGLPDRLLEPFTDGVSDEEGVGFVAGFLVAVAGNAFLGRGYLSQAITIGGRDARGNDRCGRATEWFLEAADRMRFGDPPVFVRWHRGLSEAVRRRACSMLARGVCMPMLVSDDATIAGLERLGVAPEDAADYCVIGCNELGIPGRLMDTATWRGGVVLPVDALREALLATAGRDDPRDALDLMPAFERALAGSLVAQRNGSARFWERMARELPTPFASVLMHGCAEEGRDLLTGLAYRVEGTFERGFTNAVNALAAIQHVVFERQEATLDDVRRSVREDHPDERLRDRLLGAPKWGADDERADRFAVPLLEARERALTAADAATGAARHSSCHVVRSLHHLDGQRIPATPDGRRDGEPLCDSIGPPAGVGTHGPTAALRSVARIDAPRFYAGGTNLNLTLPAGRTSAETVRSLVEGFFAEGGQEVQVSVLDPDRLRAAQRNPAAHADLLVRVAGLSARFVELSRLEQDEIIARADRAAAR